MAGSDTDAVPLDDKGRISLPKPVREALGLEPGERLAVSVEDGEIRLRPLTRTPRKLRANRKWGKEAFLKAGEASFAGEE